VYAGSSADHCEEIDIKPVVEPAGICLIVIGIILLIIAVLGIIGVCCNSRLIVALVSQSAAALPPMPAFTVYTDMPIAVALVAALRGESGAINTPQRC